MKYNNDMDKHARLYYSNNGMSSRQKGLSLFISIILFIGVYKLFPLININLFEDFIFSTLTILAILFLSIILGGKIGRVKKPF